jgi:hypothetical protein
MSRKCKNAIISMIKYMNKLMQNMVDCIAMGWFFDHINFNMGRLINSQLRQFCWFIIKKCYQK